jgi:Cytochrome P450
LEIFGKTYSDSLCGVFSFFRIARAITRDPDVYPEPEAFKPERFLNPDGTLRDDVTPTSVFGFGKRVCPGRHFVDATLFIVAATVFSVFRIERRHDTEGVPFDYTYSGGLVRCIKTVSLEDFRELIVNCLYPVARTRFRALSVQGINEQRSLLFANITITRIL